VLKSRTGVIRNGHFKVTDRAQRYRANRNIPGKQKHCFACGKPRPRDVHHIDGRENNGDPSNLTRACRSCNVRIANVMRRAGLGTKTRQYNPKRAGGHAAHSLGAYLTAVEILNGKQPGNMSSAVRTLQATSEAQRSEYARRIWEIRKERYGPSGRRDSVPF
jgi:hypothetical protein